VLSVFVYIFRLYKAIHTDLLGLQSDVLRPRQASIGGKTSHLPLSPSILMSLIVPTNSGNSGNLHTMGRLVSPIDRMEGVPEL
jgi:hypothetical protein